MTAYATRSPLQLLSNSHQMTSDSRRNGTRRTSARLADKDDAPIGIGSDYVSENKKSGQTNGAARRATGRAAASGVEIGNGNGRGKRKHGASDGVAFE